MHMMQKDEQTQEADMLTFSACENARFIRADFESMYRGRGF